MGIFHRVRNLREEMDRISGTQFVFLPLDDEGKAPFQYIHEFLPFVGEGRRGFIARWKFDQQGF